MTTSARKISRKTGNQPSRTARRPPARAATRRKSGEPRFKRVRRSLSVKPPADCRASVIFKFVAHDEFRHFAYWLLVGRYAQDTIAVRYEYTGESTLRCDVPDGTMFTPDALQPYLEAFLKSEGTEPEGPPILDGKDN